MASRADITEHIGSHPGTVWHLLLTCSRLHAGLLQHITPAAPAPHLQACCPDTIWGPSSATLTTCMLLCSAWDNGNEASLAFFILIQVLGCYIVVSVLPWHGSAICLIVHQQASTWICQEAAAVLLQLSEGSVMLIKRCLPPRVSLNHP